MPIERKLAAIMFTDIAGYTALSAKDSTKASELLKTQRHTLKPIVEKHGGSWMKEIGDGLLLTFDSATSAVECSIAIQEATKDIEDLNLRIGIHEGEVIKQDGDVIGDDVNVASRIEPFSAVGGVAISQKIEQAISSNKEFETKYIGKPKLKGVSQEVKVYCITSYGLPETDISKVSAKLEEESKFNIFALTGGILTAIGIAFWIAIGVFDVSFGGKAEVPSIGILMMENRGIEEDEFWASSITEDLIVKVAGAGLIRVAPMKEILEVDIKDSFAAIAKKLRVKYLLTSSIYKKEDGFDLHSQLIEAKSGNSRYANKWSEPIDKAPIIVGNLADNILKSLKVNTKQDIDKGFNLNADAYGLYLKAKYKYRKRTTEEDIVICEGLLSKALSIDSNLIEAKRLLGDVYFNKGNDKQALEFYHDCLEHSKNIDDNINIAESFYSIGIIHWSRNNIDTSRYYFQKSLEIFKDNNAWNQVANVQKYLSNLLGMEGKVEAGIDMAKENLNNFYKLDDKMGIARTLANISSGLIAIGDAKSFASAKTNLEQAEKIAIDNGLNHILMIINSNWISVHLYYNKYQEAHDVSSKTLSIAKALNDKIWIGHSLFWHGSISESQGDVNEALNYYMQAIEIAKNNDDVQQLDYWKMKVGFNINYRLSQLLKDTSYLETAYNQIQELTDNLEPDVASKFLSYPIPKAIVEEWEKVK